jgi:hypothetical protein
METLTIFCHHENQAFLPALSDVESLCFGTKSDLLMAFDEIFVLRKPTTTSIVLDVAAIEQMLKPAVLMQGLQRICTRNLYSLCIYKILIFITSRPV